MLKFIEGDKMTDYTFYSKSKADELLNAKVTKPTVDVGGSTGLTPSSTVTIQMLADWGIITINNLDA